MIIATIAFISGTGLFAFGMLGGRFTGMPKLSHTRRIVLGLAGLILILFGVFRASASQFCIAIVPEPATLSPTRPTYQQKSPAALGRGIIRWTKNTYSFGAGNVAFLPDECQIAIYPSRKNSDSGFGMTQNLNCSSYQQLRVTIAYPESTQIKPVPTLFSLKLNNKPRIGALLAADKPDPDRHRMRSCTYVYPLKGLKTIHKIEVVVPPQKNELVFTELRFH